MRNSDSHFLNGSGLAGIFCAALAVLALIVAGERSGLPLSWVEWFMRILLGLMLFLTIILGRTAVESAFFGRKPVAGWAGGGLVLGSVLSVAGQIVPGSRQADLWPSCLLGLLAGLVLAHLHIRRWGMLPTNSQGLSNLSDDSQTNATLFPKLMMSLASCILGVLLAMVSLKLFSAELMSVLGLATQKTILAILFVVLCGIALGGAMGTLALTGLLTLIAISGLIISVLLGFAMIGSLPLPGFESAQTLQAIAAIRQEWRLADGLFFREWPGFSGLFSHNGLTSFALSALVAGAVCLKLAPAVQVERRSAVSLATACILIIPLLIVAIGGYALEAAAELFVGTSVNRPPSALLEALRLRMITACGGFPETFETLRFQCGAGPRDVVLLETSRLVPSNTFLLSGLPVTLGFTTAIGFALRLFPVALSIIGISVGIWIFAYGLGQFIFGRRHQAPGLASFRMALTRLSALAGMVIVAGLVIFEISLSANLTGLLAGAAASVMIAAQLMPLRSSSDTPRKTAQAA